MKRAPLLWMMASLSLTGEEPPPRAAPVDAPVEVLPPEAAVDERIISRSEQFHVRGGNPDDRGAAAILAEETKDELLRLTGEKDSWKIPVNITLFGKSGDPLPPRTVALDLLYGEAGYDLRINIHLSRGLDRAPVQSAMTAALIYERALKDREVVDTETPMVVPPWLVEGLHEATAWRRQTSDRRLYEALFKRGGLFKLDDLFAVTQRGYETMDGASRAAFRISSGALVMALLEQPDGIEGFRAWLDEVAAFDGETPVLLRRHFPDLNLSETSLAKWWALQLANKGAAKLTDVLSIAETETQLAEALQLNYRDAEGLMHRAEPANWADLANIGQAERLAAVRAAEEALVRLSYRCFPSYRPVLTDYQAVLAMLAKGEAATIAASIAELDATRATMIDKAERARDFMDWFEISRARETSGAFDDYLRLKDRLKSNPRSRNDDLSRYLDRMDKIFHRGDAKPKPNWPPQ